MDKSVVERTVTEAALQHAQVLHAPLDRDSSAGDSSAGDSLTIVIPALNEEEAIGQTISRCLAARESIRQTAGLSDIEIIVVSDGSTDRTVEIASQFEDVRVIVFEKNRGYGAAIKEGWRQGHGTLLSFLDADGTCDPDYFGPMCQLSITESNDIVLGSRLGPDSKMPKIRRLGNRIYAALLGFLCGRHVTDTASGMRVVRRSSLVDLYPLPDGLHFTPSMSARALMNDLRVKEIPMPYEDRVGESKLSVLRDGVRFLKTIFSGVLCYRPEKLLLMAFTLCLVFMGLVAANPTEFYLSNGRLEEWMIYRFVACYLAGAVALLLLLCTALTHRAAFISRRREDTNAFWPMVVSSLFQGKFLASILVGLIAAAMFFLWPGLVQYATTGHVDLHWSRMIAGTFAIFSAIQTAVFAILMKIVSIWKEQHQTAMAWQTSQAPLALLIDKSEAAESETDNSQHVPQRLSA